MYDQIREDTLFIILYSVVTAMAMMASCYLLFRQGNAFAKDVTPPVRLRRWTAAFFAALVLNHVVYMPIFFLSSSEDIMTIDLIGGFLDCMALFPVAIIVLFAMLQDRRRPLWPVAAMFVPLIVGGAFGVAVRSYVLLPVVYVYFLLMCIGLIIYMVRALRQYGRWLRDNYAGVTTMLTWSTRRYGRVSWCWPSSCWCSLSMCLPAKARFINMPCRSLSLYLSVIFCGESRR